MNSERDGGIVMAKIDCEVIEDLLPVYVENMASDSSVKLVEEHLKECEGCKNLEQRMRSEIVLPEFTETGALKRLRSGLFRKEVTAAILTALIMLALLVFWIVHMHAPLEKAYEHIRECLEVTVTPEEDIMLSVEELDCIVTIEGSINAGEENAVYVTCHTTKWYNMYEQDMGRREYILNDYLPKDAMGTIDKVSDQYAVFYSVIKKGYSGLCLCSR